jgi:hypothetical protein
MKTNHAAKIYHRRRTNDVFSRPHNSTNSQNADTQGTHLCIKPEQWVNTLDSYEVGLWFEFRSEYWQF